MKIIYIFALLFANFSCGFVNAEQVIPKFNKKIVQFSERSIGRKIGDGDCWDFCYQALLSAGGRFPGSSNYIWGSEVDYKKDGLIPGDIIQMYNKGLFSSEKHTVIVIKIKSNTDFIIAEQNYI